MKIKNIIKTLILTAGALFLFCVPSNAQFINNYSIYSTVTATDSGHMKQTIVFSGTTTADPHEDPHFIAMLANATHTPTINNQITINGTVYGGLTTGFGQCWNCYVNFSTVISNIPVSDGATFTSTGTGNVICSLMGSTWLPVFSSGFKHYIKAYERVKNNYIYTGCVTDPGGFTTCNTTVTEWCTAPTSPSMLALNAVHVQTFPLFTALDGPYFDAVGFGFRFGNSGPYTFSNLTTYAVGLPSPQLLGICTPRSAQ